MTGAGEKKNKRQTGAYYEREAGRYLEQMGYEILEYNYRCRSGEIASVKFYSENKVEDTPL